MGTMERGQSGMLDRSRVPSASTVSKEHLHTIQAACGAQSVQHLLTPLCEAILGPRDTL